MAGPAGPGQTLPLPWAKLGHCAERPPQALRDGLLSLQPHTCQAGGFAEPQAVGHWEESTGLGQTEVMGPGSSHSTNRGFHTPSQRCP